MLLRMGAEGARGWRLGSKMNPLVHLPHYHPTGLRRSHSPLPLAWSQNYLLLPRRPQAESQEVHSLWRQSREDRTRVSNRTTLRAEARHCPGAGPTELLVAQGPA